MTFEMIGGLRIVPHPLAVTRRMEVQRHPIKKRRRNWSLVRVERPGCWQMGNTFFMHPDLVQKLKEQSAASVTEGCDFCRNPLFAGTKCKNCGRGACVTEVSRG